MKKGDNKPRNLNTGREGERKRKGKKRREMEEEGRSEKR